VFELKRHAGTPRGPSTSDAAEGCPSSARAPKALNDSVTIVIVLSLARRLRGWRTYRRRSPRWSSILTCADVHFPEAAGVLRVRRADIIAIPTSWGTVRGPSFTIGCYSALRQR